MEEKSIMDKNVADGSTPVTTDVGSEHQEHKKKKPLFIVGIILAILIVIGGGVGAFAFFSWKNSPEGVALDMFSNLMKEKNVTTTGKIKLTNMADAAYDSAEITLKNITNSDANTSFSADIAVGDDHKIGLQGIYLSDGDLYFKIEDKSDAYGSLGEVEDLLGTVKVNTVTTTSVNGIFDIDNLSDIWWKVSIPEITEVLGEYFGSAFSSMVDGVYSCVTNAMKEVYQNSDEQIELYKKNNFISLKEKSENVYNASIDRNKFVGFVNSMNDTVGMKKLNSCLGSLGAFSSTISANITDEESIVEKIPSTFVVSMNDKRQLTKIAFQSDSDGARMDIDLSFEYNGYTNISAPNDSTSITELVSESLEGVFGNFKSYNDCGADSEGCTTIDYSSLIEQFSTPSIE